MSIAQGQYYANAITGFSLSGNNEYISSIANGTAYKLRSNNGQGMNLGIGLGYKINSSFSVEVNYYTQLLAKKKYTILFYDNMDLGNAEVQRTIKHNTHQVAPLFVFSKPLNKLSIFLKLGPNFLYCKTITDQNVYDDGMLIPDHDYSNWTVEDKGGINIGIRGAAGIQFELTNKLGIQCELHSVLTNYTYTETNVTSQSEITDPIAVFFFNYNRKEPYIVDFSQYGFNIAITYKLGNK